MRLSSPRFAYLPLLQKTLFSTVQLVPTPDHLENLARADISRLTSFANTINFVAPAKNWTITLEGFREVVIAQAIQKHAWDSPNRPIFSTCSFQAYIKRHWNGKFPVSDDQIRVGFEKYHAEALAIRDLLLGGELETAWISALQVLQNVRHLRFVSARHVERDGEHLPAAPDCIIRPHDHGDDHPYESCDRAATAMGDAVFAAGIGCVAKADLKAQILEVRCFMTGDFGWESLSSWQRLDLSQLQEFRFGPRMESELPDYWKQSEVIADRATDAVAAVLRKCKGSLEYLRYEPPCPMRWPDQEVIPLPKLRDLYLAEGFVRTGNLSRWMAGMLLLKCFQLEYADHCEGGWMDLFDAIRDHPNRIRISFEETITVQDFESFGMDYDTADFEIYLETPESDDPYENIERSLALYLSGKIEYDETLGDWLRED